MSSPLALDLSLELLRYPIGRFAKPVDVTESDRRDAIAALASLPDALRTAVARLSDSQLDTPYREGGWSIRQLVHHVADSHMNASVRMRLALTEDWPTIKGYEEAEWAELADAKTLPTEVSLSLLESLHQRWVVLLGSLGEEQWRRGYVHPALGRQALDTVAMLYSWHSRHHTAHVTELRKRLGW